MRHVHPQFAKKLFYFTLGGALVLGVLSSFLPPQFEWFARGAILGMVLSMGFVWMGSR
jgi:hypothetical protein